MKKLLSYRVLHVLDHSWPVLDGYSVRSGSLVAAQRRSGMCPVVLTGPLHQLEDSELSEVTLNGVGYMRTPLGSGLPGQAILKRWPILRQAAVVRLLRRQIVALLERERFDVVHAHSPALCGLAAWRATQPRGIPWVYEIRAFWEDAAVIQGKTTESSVRYRLSRALEAYLIARANAIVGIAQPILGDLRARGVPHEKLFYVPNGVDADRFSPRPRDAELAAQLGLNGKPTLGFIGTLFGWEGLPWLVRASVELLRRGASFNLLIVGDGEDGPATETAIREAGAANYIHFVGRVPHDQVERYYSVMDLLVYPRRRTRITEMVTPLKPLEAMAQGKAVLASNVGGMRELIDADSTGILFEPDDLEDFCRKASQLLEHENWRRALGERARQKILREKDWGALARRYESVYEFAVRNARSGP